MSFEFFCKDENRDEKFENRKFCCRRLLWIMNPYDVGGLRNKKLPSLEELSTKLNNENK